MLQRGDERYFSPEGKLLTPVALWLLILLFMRGYAAWIISLTFMEDRSRLLQFFYTSTEQFSLALIIGLPALFIVVMMSQIGDEIPRWVVRVAPLAPNLLWLAWLLDGWLLISLIAARFPEFSVVKGVLLFAWLIALWLLLFSRSLRRFWQLLAVHEER